MATNFPATPDNRLRNSAALRTQSFSQMPKVPALDVSMEFPVLYHGANYTIEASLLKTLFTKESIGLGMVDNTSDMDKPISTATQVAIDDLIARLNQKANATDLSATNARVTINERDIAELKAAQGANIPYTKVDGFDDRVNELIDARPAITPSAVAGPNDW